MGRFFQSFVGILSIGASERLETSNGTRFPVISATKIVVIMSTFSLSPRLHSPPLSFVHFSSFSKQDDNELDCECQVTSIIIMNFFWGDRGKLAWIKAMLVSWMFLWGVFSLFVYPSLLPEAGGRDEYYAFAVDSKAPHGKAETRDTSPLYNHRLDGIFLPLIQRSRTLQLSAGAVPARNRIPPSAGQNVTEYFMASPQHVAPHRKYLFDYNPSIIRVRENQVPEALAAEAVYLASFRVSNLNYCFHPGTLTNVTMAFMKERKETCQTFYIHLLTHLLILLFFTNLTRARNTRGPTARGEPRKSITQRFARIGLS